jgi:hypothetical protein
VTTALLLSSLLPRISSGGIYRHRNELLWRSMPCLFWRKLQKKRQLSKLKQGEGSSVEALMPQRGNGRAKQSRNQAAEIVGVGERYVSDAKRIQIEAPHLLPEIKAGHTTITQAINTLKGKGHEKFITAKTDEHYTPKDILDAVVNCMGKLT